MMRVALYLFAAPVVFAFPWLPLALRRRWGPSAIWLTLWLAALWMTIELWAGPGVIALMVLGTAGTISTKFRL